MDGIIEYVKTTNFFSDDYFFTTRISCVGITEVRTYVMRRAINGW